MECTREKVIEKHLDQSGVWGQQQWLPEGHVSRYHLHQGFELLYIHAGLGRFQLGEKRVDLRPGCLVVLDALYPHVTEVYRGTRVQRTVIHFARGSIKHAGELDIVFSWITKWGLRKVDCADDYFEVLLGKLMDIGQLKPNRVTRLQMSCLLSLILVEIGCRCGLLNNEDQFSSYKEELVFRCISYIDENWNNNPSLDEIAGRLHVSKYYLSRLFRKTMGISFREFVLERRIQHAKRLLLSTDWSIQDIADALGYSSAPTFSRSFSAAVGMSPRTFRKAYAQLGLVSSTDRSGVTRPWDDGSGCWDILGWRD